MPPAYNSREHWDERFSKESSFDWLLSTNDTSSMISEQLEEAQSDLETAEILHIGCGNSDLSYHIQDLVGANGRITNVDYSETVIERAKAESRWGGGRTKWIAADLLSPSDIKRQLTKRTGQTRHGLGGYGLIVDKSTSDSIACVEDQTIALPYPIKETSRNLKGSSALNKAPGTTTIHPLRILALHLALLAPRHGCRWLAFSYSQERFAFLENEDAEAGDSSDGQMNGGIGDAPIPDPRRLWRLERKWSIERSFDDGQTVESRGGSAGIVHRPPELCWVYVLVRTDVGVGWA